MKKLCICVLLSTLIIFGMFAQTNTSTTQEDSYFYQSVPVFKVFSHKDGYLVIYQKNDSNLNKVAFPKEWFDAFDKRGSIKALPKNLDPYMSVFYNNGSFDCVIIYMPVSKLNSTWGMLTSKDDISGFMASESFVLEL